MNWEIDKVNNFSTLDDVYIVIIVIVFFILYLRLLLKVDD